MTDKQLFEELVKRMIEEYKLDVEQPYGDGYRIFRTKSGYELGDFNSDGYSLLYNIQRLSRTLRGFER